MNLNRKRILGISAVNPQVIKSGIAVLEKSIMEGTYQVKADYIPEKIVKNLFFDLLPTSTKSQ